MSVTQRGDGEKAAQLIRLGLKELSK